MIAVDPRRNHHRQVFSFEWQRRSYSSHCTRHCRCRLDQFDSMRLFLPLPPRAFSSHIAAATARVDAADDG